jgi:hypothetical protein
LDLKLVHQQLAERTVRVKTAHKKPIKAKINKLRGKDV